GGWGGWASVAGSGEVGRISASANLRAVICQERCSLLRVKSMGSALGLFGCEHGGARWSAIARQRLGDAQLGIAVARAGMQADERVVHELLQRHVPQPAQAPT